MKGSSRIMSPATCPSRRPAWRSGLPRLSAALPVALGLLCLLLAFKASLRFSSDLLFPAEPASVAADRPSETPPSSKGESQTPRDPGAPSTGCDEGPAQLPGVASVDLRSGSPLPAHCLAGALPPRSEAERSPPRLSSAVASAADLCGPLSAVVLPCLPRAPPRA
jgi:hypothetical protein